jgi:predicted nucleic acid-binding protein
MGEELVVGAHSLVEMYSVLTRIPEWRMAPRDATALIRANFGDVPIIELPVREVWKSLDEAPRQGVRGGRIHDALIARCAIHGGATTLLTRNVRRFSVFAAELQVTAPPP